MRNTLFTTTLALALCASVPASALQVGALANIGLVAPTIGTYCPKPKVHFWKGGGATASSAGLPNCNDSNPLDFLGYIFFRRYGSIDSFANDVVANCDGSKYNNTVDWQGLKPCEASAAEGCMNAKFNDGDRIWVDAVTMLPNCEAGFFIAHDPPVFAGCEVGSVGNPINPGSCNEHFVETDFRSGDGKLSVARVYNSNASLTNARLGGWQLNMARRSLPLYQTASDRRRTSSIYNLAEDACLDGWDEIKSLVGSTATASYDNNVCELSTGEVLTVYTTNSDAAWQTASPGVFAGVTLEMPDGALVDFACAGGSCTTRTDRPLQLTASSTGYVLRDQQDRSETYDAQGLLLSIVDRDGYAQNLAYDVDGQLLSVTDILGRQISYGYTSGKLTSATFPDGSSVSYTYDVRDRLASVTYPGGATRQYKYEFAKKPNGLTKVVDERSNDYLLLQYDTQGRAISTALAGPVNNWTLDYNNDGSTTVTDYNGVERVFNYVTIQGRRKLQSVTGEPCDHCNGVYPAISYDSNGYVDTRTDWRGMVTDYNHDARGLETSRVDADGTAVERRTETDWHVSFRVPLERRIYDAASALQGKEQWAYNTRGQMTAHCRIDPADSNATGYTCNAGTAPPSGSTVQRWTYAYCEAGDVAVPGSTCPILGLAKSTNGPRSSSDAGMASLDDVTTYTYYAATDETGCGTAGGTCHRKGDLWKTTNALGHVQEIVAYDKNGRPVRLRDANGTLTDLSYHARGWLLSRTVRALASGVADSGDATLSVTYDATGQVTRVTQPDASYFDYVYDTAHRLTDVIDALGNRVHYTLDAAGNRIKEETYDASYNPATPAAGLQRKLSRQYNALNRLVRTLNAANAATRDSTPYDTSPLADGYDANGNAVRFKDGRDIQAYQSYDALNRLVQSIQDYTGTSPETGNATVEYTYDARDNLLSVEDPDGLTTTYTFDGLGNQTDLDSPDTGNTGYTYDRAGNRISQTDNRGVTSTYSYDALNRLRGVGYPDTSLNISYIYDEDDTTTGCVDSYPMGRLTTMADSSDTTVYCYDRRGNVVRKIQSMGFELTYAYDLADRLSTITYPSGAIVYYGRDSVGRITTVQRQADAMSPLETIVSDISYYPFGPLHVLSFYSGRTLTKAYDSDYAIDSVTSSAADGLWIDFATDVMGNIVGANGPAPANVQREYVYDNLYRLTEVVDPSSNAMAEDYAYNKTGDRTLKHYAGQPSEAYTYLSGTHRLGSVAGVARSYDDNGNTTDRGDGITLGYDDRNRLVSADVPNNATTYDYSGRGERVFKLRANGGTQLINRYVYNESGQLLFDSEFNSAGAGSTTAVEYLYVDAMPVAQMRGGKLSYIETDHLGTPRVASDPAGKDPSWMWGFFGSGFGDHGAVAPIGNRSVGLRFEGQIKDEETDISYNFFRNYDNGTGRFLESDPVGLAAGTNTYAYADNSPVVSSDPLGLDGTDYRRIPGPGIPIPVPMPGQSGDNRLFPKPTHDWRDPPPPRWPDIPSTGATNHLPLLWRLGEILWRACTEDDEKEECQKEIRECTALCNRARRDTDLRNVWGGSFYKCLTGCVSWRCQDYIEADR